jgi:hypothetical protein
MSEVRLTLDVEDAEVLGSDVDLSAESIAERFLVCDDDFESLLDAQRQVGSLLSLRQLAETGEVVLDDDPWLREFLWREAHECHACARSALSHDVPDLEWAAADEARAEVYAKLIEQLGGEWDGA